MFWVMMDFTGPVYFEDSQTEARFYCQMWYVQCLSVRHLNHFKYTSEISFRSAKYQSR